jgi:hypothetical protein
MSLTVPSYIPLDSIRKAPLNHKWDDWDPYALLGEQDVETLTHLRKSSDRAQIAYAIACAEWVIWRFVDLSPDGRPYALLESAWAGEMSLELVAPPQLLEDEWKGPIRGPIDLALVTIINTFYSTEDRAGDQDAAFSELIALHVLADKGYFLEWKIRVLERLENLFPRTIRDPEGVPVPREAMDPNINISGQLRQELVTKFLSELDYDSNPFLKSARIRSDQS